MEYVYSYIDFRDFLYQLHQFSIILLETNYLRTHIFKIT